MRHRLYNLSRILGRGIIIILAVETIALTYGRPSIIDADVETDEIFLITTIPQRPL